ncbi:MAG: hypothetical protein ACREMH_02335 [Gemmatimonadales bacterium]
MTATLVRAFGLLSVLAFGATPAPGQELMLAGGPFEASALPLNASGRWLALVDVRGSNLAPVTVTIGSALEECTGAPGAARTVKTAGAEPVALFRRVAGLRAGSVPTGTIEPAGGWREPRSGEFDGKPFVVSEERAGEGFRLRYSWGGRSGTVFEADAEDEGHWDLLWLGDLNRDGWPDLLLQADRKYSVRTTRLLLSRVRHGAWVVEEVASFGITAC